MKHCFKKFMALLLATLMVMSAFSGIVAVAADTICTHPEEKLTKWQVGGEETVAPTCTTAGYTWYKCECGKVTARDFVPALGHDMAWMAKKVVIDTTTDADEDGKADAVVDYVNGIDCGDTYEIYYGCSRAECDYVEKWTGAGDQDFGPGYKTHNYTSYKVTTDPTCVANGELELICANHADCPRVQVLIRRLNDNKGEHEFAIDTGSEIILEHKDNNCTEDGYTKYACIYCYIVSGATKTITDPKTGHSYDRQYALDSEGVNNGTKFVEEGSCLVKYECTNDGCDATDEQYVHAYGNEEYFRNQAGATYESCFYAKQCERCKDFKDVRYEHKIDKAKTEWTVDAENNLCTVHYTCEYCGYKWDVRSDDENEEEAMKAHKSLELLYSVLPTCTEFGYNSYVCRACGDKMLKTEPPRGHDTNALAGSDRITVKKATCLAPGGTYVRCDRVNNGVKCTYESLVTDTEPQLDHKYETVSFTPATCIAVSILVEKCVNGCGDVRTTKGTAVEDDAHAMEDYQVTTFPTCDTDGIAALYCKLCHYEDTAIKYNEESMANHPNFDFNRIKKFGHVYNPIYHADMDGYKAGLAALPENKDADTKNDISVSTTISALTTVEIVASCSYEGKKTTTCDLCDLNEVVTTPKNSENHVNFGTDGTGVLVENGYYAGGYVDAATGKTYLRLPNCDSPALLWYFCNSCFQPYSVTDADTNALGHKVDKVKDYDANVDQYIKGTNPTCTEPGVTDKWVIHCKNEFEQLERMKGIKDGDKWYADVNGNGKIDADDVELGDAAIGTEYAGFKVVDGYVVKTVTANNITYTYNKYYKVIVKCTHEAVYGGDPLPKRGHDWEVTGDALTAYKNSSSYTAAKAPTCEDAGNVEKVYCAECKTYKVENGVTLDGHELPALGHSWMRDGYDTESDLNFKAAQDSTCTEEGWIAHYQCTVCKGTDKIEADGTHDNKVGDNVTVAKKPHVAANRDEAHYCGNPDHMKAPTCAEVGYGFGDVCANCGTCLGHDEIAKLEHNTIILTNAAANCEDPSFTFEFCTICAHVETCGEKDNSKFIASEDQVPVCALGTEALLNSNGSFTNFVGNLNIPADKCNISAYNYATLKITYYFAHNADLKTVLDAGGTKLDLVCNGKVLDSQTITYSEDKNKPATVSFDLRYLNSDTNSFVLNTGNGIILNATGIFKAELVGETEYGCREINDFVYYSGHKYVDAIKPLEGNDYACECVGYVEYQKCALCGAPKADSEKEPVSGKGHTIPDHTETVINTKFVACTAACCTQDKLVGDLTGLAFNAQNQLMVDAHENSYVYDPEIVIHKSIATSTDRDNKHVVSHFQVYACTECDFRDIDIAKDPLTGKDMVYEEGHNWVEITELYVEPTYEKVGSRTYYCADNCGVDNKTREIPKKSATELTMDVENMLEKEHNMTGIGYTDGSLVALTVKLSSLETLMWGFQFDVVYDQSKVAFEGYKFVTEKFESNQYAIDHLAYTEGVLVPGSNFVRVSASTLTPYDPENPGAPAGATNTKFVGDEDLVVLYFRINCYEAAEAIFSFKEVKVVNNGNVDVNGDGTITEAEKNVDTASSDTASVVIRRFMNICNDETIDISDALYTWKILSGEFNATYDVTIDVDKNGVIDVTDFLAVYQFVVGEITYEEVRGMGIPA